MIPGCVFYGPLVVVTLPKHVFPFPGIVFKLSFRLITSVTITLMIGCWMVISLLLLLRSWTRLKPAFPITIKDTLCILKPGQNKKGQKIFRLHRFLNTLLQLAAEKKYSKNGAAGYFFGPSYFVTALVLLLT